jgi:polyphosphate kinase
VIDPLLRQRVRQEILYAYLADEAKARILEPSGDYFRPRARANGRHRASQMRFNAQEFLIALAEGNASLAAIPPPAARPQRVRHLQRVGQA